MHAVPLSYIAPRIQATHRVSAITISQWLKLICELGLGRHAGLIFLRVIIGRPVDRQRKITAALVLRSKGTVSGRPPRFPSNNGAMATTSLLT